MKRNSNKARKINKPQFKSKYLQSVDLLNIERRKNTKIYDIHSET